MKSVMSTKAFWSMIHRMNSYWMSPVDFTPDKEYIEHISTRIFTTWKTLVLNHCVCIPENTSRPLSSARIYFVLRNNLNFWETYQNTLECNKQLKCHTVYKICCKKNKKRLNPLALPRLTHYESEEQKNACDKMGVTWVSGSDWKTFSLFFTALCLKYQYNWWGANSVSAHLI